MKRFLLFFCACLLSLSSCTDGNINRVIRYVQADLTLSPQEALDATGFRQYVDDVVMQSMPRVQQDAVKVVFFRVGHSVSDAELKEEYDIRNLRPLDPYYLAKVNEDDQSFAKKHPNATQWRDAYGNTCYVVFVSWGDQRDVHVGCTHHGWDDFLWFAGVLK